MRENAHILVQVDKTVVKITGLSVRGLDTTELERLLQQRLHSMVRVIGVTGDRLELDIYGVEDEDILRDETGIVHAVSLARGITVSDVAQMESVEKIRAVPFDRIPPHRPGQCRAERWMSFDR